MEARETHLSGRAASGRIAKPPATLLSFTQPVLVLIPASQSDLAVLGDSFDMDNYDALVQFAQNPAFAPLLLPST